MLKQNSTIWKYLIKHSIILLLLFFIINIFSVAHCQQSGSSDTSWRVARSPRRAAGTEGYYYSDSVTNLDFLKNASEGTNGIFEKNEDTFGSWTTCDSDPFFCLVTSLENCSGCWSASYP